MDKVIIDKVFSHYYKIFPDEMDLDDDYTMDDLKEDFCFNIQNVKKYPCNSNQIINSFNYDKFITYEINKVYPLHTFIQDLFKCKDGDVRAEYTLDYDKGCVMDIIIKGVFNNIDTDIDMCKLMLLYVLADWEQSFNMDMIQYCKSNDLEYNSENTMKYKKEVLGIEYSDVEFYTLINGEPNPHYIINKYGNIYLSQELMDRMKKVYDHFNTKQEPTKSLKTNTHISNVDTTDMRTREKYFDMLYNELYENVDKEYLSSNPYKHKGDLKKKFLKNEPLKLVNGRKMCDHQLILLNKYYELHLKCLSMNI